MDTEAKNRITGRFAPSPSGRMHVGNLLSALLAWLSARAAGGRMVLRMEDLDPDRTSRALADQLEDDLRFLGFDWDEGGSAGGPNGPYYQSGRTGLYAEALAQLEKKGLLYPCFCTRAQLHAAEAPHNSDGETIYSGRCRGLAAEQIEAQARLRAPAVRLRLPDETVRFVDGHYGPVEQNLARECGDIILRRSDGVFAYQLAVVLDDIAMGVTQVVRGRDLLSSTPRQMYLYRLFGASPPQYIHVPLLLARDGRRLSKREHDLDLGALRARGFSGEEIVGRVAYLAGLLPHPRPARPRDLLPLFSWEKVPKENLVLPEDLFRDAQ